MGELIHSPVYNQEQVRRGLLTLASHGGNTESAALELAANNLPIDASTLRYWRRETYPELYREIHDTHGREIEAALLPEFRETAILAAQAAQEAVTAARTQLANGNCKDPAGAARNLTVTAATAMDKVYLATDRPTEIRTTTDPQGILERLAAAHPTIQGTATELDHGSFLPEGPRSNAQEH